MWRRGAEALPGGPAVLSTICRLPAWAPPPAHYPRRQVALRAGQVRLRRPDVAGRAHKLRAPPVPPRKANYAHHSVQIMMVKFSSVSGTGGGGNASWCSHRNCALAGQDVRQAGGAIVKPAQRGDVPLPEHAPLPAAPGRALRRESTTRPEPGRKEPGAARDGLA